MIDALAHALINLAILGAIFVPLERVFPARVQGVLRPHLALDAAFFFGQYLVVTSAIVAALTLVAERLPRGAIATHLPAWQQVILAVALGDFVVYWFHRACHRVPLLWRFHAVHHTSEHLDWLAAHREHPLDGLFTMACLNLPALLLGVRMEVLAGVAVFRGLWSIFVHSNVRLPLGPLRVLLGAPELHHWHHARVETTHNFANLAPWLDWVFGTYHCPEGEERWPLGIPEAWPRSYLRLLLEPLGLPDRLGPRPIGAPAQTRVAR